MGINKEMDYGTIDNLSPFTGTFIVICRGMTGIDPVETYPRNI